MKKTGKDGLPKNKKDFQEKAADTSTCQNSEKMTFDEAAEYVLSLSDPKRVKIDLEKPGMPKISDEDREHYQELIDLGLIEEVKKTKDSQISDENNPDLSNE